MHRTHVHRDGTAIMIVDGLHRNEDTDVNTNAARQLDLFGQPRARRVTKRPLTPDKLIAIAVGMFRASRPVQGTLGAKFFAMRRLEVPAADVVRFHASLKFNDMRAPGLIFLMRDQRTGEPCGVMRLFLDEFGWVIGKKVLGRAWGATVMPRPP